MAGDSVVEALNEGTDLVRSLAAWTLGANLENLILAGSAAIDGTGNALADAISGNAASNTITGGDGSDWLDGLAGDDVISGGVGDDGLVGGAGADALMGGPGNDTYYVDTLTDATVEMTGEGSDVVRSPVGWTLAAEIESLGLTHRMRQEARGSVRC